MAVVVIGPSSVGKSTLLAAESRDKYIEPKYNKIMFGYEIRRKPITNNAIIHYNMLFKSSRHYPRLIFRPDSRRWRIINRDWDFNSEPVFRKIFDSGLVEKCIVLVAPLNELVERVKIRLVSEVNSRSQYPGRFWLKATTSLQLYRIYEQLFDILERRAVPYEVYFSSSSVDDFLATDRVFVHANLKGKHIPVPTKEQVETIVRNPEFLYQSVRLPHGIMTKTRGHQHLQDDREHILKSLLADDLSGRISPGYR